MFTRTCCLVVAATLTLAALQTRAAHDSGEQVRLEGTSEDGQFALVRIEDVQRRFVDWLLSDVDGKRSIRRRFDGDKSTQKQRSYVAKLKRSYRIGPAPKPLSTHPNEPLEGRFYTWVSDDKTLHRAFSVVGRLGQIVQPSLSIRCFKDNPLSCPGATQTWPVSSKVDVHWFRTNVYLVVDTWFVEDIAGTESRTFVVHRRLPVKPQRPLLPVPQYPPAPKGTESLR